MDAATHSIRVPFQRRQAFAGRHVPHLERVVARRRHDAPPVRKHGNAIDLRRSHIITKVQRTPQRTQFECPSSVATHLPVATSQTLSVLSPDPDTTRRPSGNTATPRPTTKLHHHKSTADAATHGIRVPFQRPQLDELRQVHAFGERDMNRRSPRAAVATALASQIDCNAPSSVRLPTGSWRRRVDRGLLRHGRVDARLRRLVTPFCAPSLPRAAVPKTLSSSPQ